MIDYDPHDWNSHLLDIRGSMVREIVLRLTACIAWTTLVVTVDEWAGLHLGFGAALHGLVGFALGLLLVFRTNSSYDRYWEGRKMWGGMVNETRNLAPRQAYLPQAPELRDAVVRWTIAFPYASMYSLRGWDGLPLAAQLSQLPADAVEQTLRSNHMPLAVARRISGTLVEARDRGLLSDYLLGVVDQNVQLLIDYHGACERIRNTPLPYAYMVHLRRALILYCYTLPFALMDNFGWYTIPAVLLLAFVFFGIEEIGVEIEDPFGDDENDLPLERICATIERNLVSLIASESPDAETPASGVLRPPEPPPRPASSTAALPE